jgi:mxaJ protein
LLASIKETNTMKRNMKQAKSGRMLPSFLALLLGSGLAFNAQANTSTLKVCAASDEMPYSNKQQEGFENELAKILADTMDRELEFVWSDKAAIFLVTEKLLKNQCDVVMGVDKGDPRVATSDPYYKSGYAFIYPADKGLDIKNWLSPALKDMSKFAIVPGSPSEVMLREIDKYEGNFNYTMSLIGFKSRRNQYVRYAPDLLVSEVVSGKADIAHIWAPEAARYVKSASVPLKMVVSEEIAPTHDGEGVRQQFEQAIAVRSDDQELLKEINTALHKADPKIKAVLKDEGIPLL